MGLAQKLVDGVLIMKNKFVFSLVLTLVWLSVCGVTCHPYDDMNGRYFVGRRFHDVSGTLFKLTK